MYLSFTAIILGSKKLENLNIYFEGQNSIRQFDETDFNNQLKTVKDLNLKTLSLFCTNRRRLHIPIPINWSVPIPKVSWSVLIPIISVGYVSIPKDISLCTVLYHSRRFPFSYYLEWINSFKYFENFLEQSGHLNCFIPSLTEFVSQG